MRNWKRPSETEWLLADRDAVPVKGYIHLDVGMDAINYGAGMGCMLQNRSLLVVYLKRVWEMKR